MRTAAIRMGDGHVVHSCGDCEVDVPMGPGSIAQRFYVMDTEVFDLVLGTDFFAEHLQSLSLTLQAPYVLHVDHSFIHSVTAYSPVSKSACILEQQKIVTSGWCSRIIGGEIGCSLV